MAIEKIKELLKAVKTDPEAQAKLQGLTKPADEDGIIRYYAEAAKKLSFDVTEADLRAFLAEATADRTGKTEDAAAKVQALQDDELAQAAGGGRSGGSVHCDNNYSSCVDTYRQRENCWFNDGCDLDHNHYSDYLCEHNYNGHICGDAESQDCSQVFF